jgi:hypothetical protein
MTARLIGLAETRLAGEWSSVPVAPLKVNAVATHCHTTLGISRVVPIKNVPSVGVDTASDLAFSLRKISNNLDSTLAQGYSHDDG